MESNTPTESWLDKHWSGLLAVVLTALYIYLQLIVWKRHGDDLMLTAASVVITLLVLLILIFAIANYFRLARKAKRLLANAEPTRKTDTSEAKSHSAPLQREPDQGQK